MNPGRGTEIPMAHPEKPKATGTKAHSRRPMVVQSGWKASLERYVKKAALPVAKIGLAIATITGVAHHVDRNLGGPVGAVADTVGSAGVQTVKDTLIKPIVNLGVDAAETGREIVMGVSRDYKPTSFYSKDGVFNFSNAIFTTSKGEASDPSLPNGFDKNQIVEINGLPVNDTVIQNGLLLIHPAFSHDDQNGKDYLLLEVRTNSYPGEITLYVDPGNPQYKDGKVLTLTPGGKMEDIYGTQMPAQGPGNSLTIDQINIAKPLPTPRPKAP